MLLVGKVVLEIIVLRWIVNIFERNAHFIFGHSLNNRLLFFLTIRTLSIVLGKLFPQIIFPFVKLLIGELKFRVALARSMKHSCTKFRKHFYKVSTHGIKLLIGCISKSEDGKAHILELFAGTILLEALDPLVEFSSVVTWFTLVVCGHENYVQLVFILTKFLFIKIFEVYNLGAIEDL